MGNEERIEEISKRLDVFCNRVDHHLAYLDRRVSETPIDPWPSLMSLHQDMVDVKTAIENAFNKSQTTAFADPWPVINNLIDRVEKLANQIRGNKERESTAQQKIEKIRRQIAIAEGECDVRSWILFQDVKWLCNFVDHTLNNP